MATINYTDRGIKGLIPDRTLTRYYDATGIVQGLHFSLTPTGKRTWAVAYKFNGQRKFHKIGTYPATSIKDARIKGAKVWEKVEAGIDPNEPVDEPKKVGTVRDLFDEYIKDCSVRGVRSIYYIERALEPNVIDYLGSMPANEVTSQDIYDCLKRIIEHGSNGQCNIVRQYARALFEFGLKAPFNLRIDSLLDFGITVNPVNAIAPVQGTIADDVYPTLQDIACIWVEAENYGRVANIAAVRSHIAAVGNRGHDTLGRRWADIQEVQGTGIIHIGRTKTGRPHSIVRGTHLNMALDLLDARANIGKDEVIFRGNTSNGQTALGYKALNDTWRKIRTDFELTDNITPKTMRRAWKTLMGDAGVSLEHRNVLQGHSNNSVASRHYDRSEQIDLKVEMTAKWDEMLAAAITEYRLSKSKLYAVA